MVFHDHGNHWLRPLLKEDFKHVFAVVQTDDHWIMVDPRNGTPVIEVVAPATYDLARFYRAEGFAVVETERRDVGPFGPVMLSNCVGAVKAVIGLRAPFVFTPYQLYRRLTC